MRRLPPLVAGSSRSALPVSDASATVLAQVLLADDPVPWCEALVGALSGDPPLLLWAVCVSGCDHRFQPSGIEDIARWLAEHVLEVMQWEPGEDTQSPQITGSQRESYSDRVGVAVQVAELAVRLAAAERPPAAESALLLGLLHNASEWLAATAEPPLQGAPTCLPAWLATLDGTPAADCVERAVAVLADEQSLPDSVEVDLDDCRRRAEEARRRWLAPVQGIADRLPVLAAKLARLADLDTRFQEVLKTEKLEALAEFAAGAGHEINNPLTVIAGRAHLFLGEEKDPQRRRALALMHAQAMRVSEMIADMMLFARPPQPRPEKVELVELIDGLLAEISPQVAWQEITLCRVGDDGPVEIEVDPAQLTVALRAMCQNALEAIGRNGRVEIGVQPGDGDVEIRVSDNGPGIPPEDRRHLFDPYYSARQAGRGLGLGLSKCWRIVTNHGGRIDVQSEPGHGAVFTIRLPRRQEI
jgi:signal transduction histidine kinase